MNNNSDILPIDVLNKQKLDVTDGKKKNLKFMLIILGIVVFLIIGTIFASKYITEYIADTKANVTYKINYNNFTFDVLNKYYYNINDELVKYLTFSDDTNSWLVKININKGSYANLKSEILKIRPLFEENNIVVKNVNVKKLNNREYIAIEIINNGKNQILLYTNYESNYLISILLVNKTYTFDYIYVENIEPILSNIKINNNIDNIVIDNLELPNIKELLS